ncbi:putative invasin [Xenorhabdus beddingii]|uniref:Putative invasin n=1 Tax=Xenorhabdus beddingii TaxID=40578 RepID=A0A1Y2SSI7_9GAMM|nr:inverse autotransporter beta domain-containing protein [Xenorhabdus beddingii]OTA20841.1 putative invasin [Xenorhabdus beddingii]
MDSYISHKVFRLSVLVYSLFLPFTPINAFSAGEKNDETKTERKFLNKSQDQANNEDGIDGGVIAHNIQRVSNVLSSSPSQLTEQAKSYALGKINNTISSETQRWLSQFGTAKIDFSLDRKGKLDNSSLDLLLPLYDNHADWLVFSQLGYRHKDSRHTVNLGLGGRYFTPDWMYGLNTFFDHDVTGKNKRLGLGGEAWTNYVKLSANTYWRLSKWHHSPKEQDYEERPANGFDLNGEFFLPAYPNLGGKLGYEQYFGDNVALFNRDTKQKNPSLARIGLNYTPIPLITMGVDYKLGSNNHSETLFRANLNYRFGVPLGTQVSPDSVASMRTLAGSRYDLVQRNNNIVLDYKKKIELTLGLPSDLRGYSGQLVQVKPNVTTNTSLKSIHWTPGEGFKENGGLITSLPNAHEAGVILPRYNASAGDGANNYILSAIAEEEGGSKSKAAHMNLLVEPFVIKDQSIKPNAKDPSSYDLAATITYGNKDNPPLKEVAIPDVKWTLEPPNDHAKLTWEPTGTLNEQGQLTATLTSRDPLQKDTKIYLAMDGMPKVEIKRDSPLVFANGYNIKTHSVEPTGPLSTQSASPPTYFFKAIISDEEGYPVKNKEIDATWIMKQGDTVLQSNVDTTFGSNMTTDDQGQLTAQLIGQKAVKDIIVTLVLNGSKQQISFDPVSFIDDSHSTRVTEINFDKPGPYIAVSDRQHKVTVKIVKADGTPYAPKTAIPNLQWFINPSDLKDKGFTVKPDATTNGNGDLEATFTNSHAMNGISLGFSIDGGAVFYSQPFDFTAPDDATLAAKLVGPVEVIAIPDSEKGGNEGRLYTLKVKAVHNKTGDLLKDQSIKDITWSTMWKKEANHLPELLEIQKPQDGEGWVTDSEGYLTAYLARKEGKKGGINDLAVSVAFGSNQPLQSDATISIKPIEQTAGLRLKAQGEPFDPYKDYQPEDSGTGFPRYLTPKSYFSLLRAGDKQEITPALREKMDIDLKIDSNGLGLALNNTALTIEVPQVLISITNEAKIIANLTDKATGEITVHSYTMKPKYYAHVATTGTPSNPSYIVAQYKKDTGPDATCETLRSGPEITPDYTDLGIESSNPDTAYGRQFSKDFILYGVFDPKKPVYPYVKIKHTFAKTGTQYLLYNRHKRNLPIIEAPDDLTYLLCLKDLEGGTPSAQ